MLKDPLISILGDDVRSKLIRLFAINRDDIFTKDEIRKSLKVSAAKLTSALRKLQLDGIIKSKKGTRTVEKKVKGKVKRVKERFDGFVFNKRYQYRAILEDLILHTVPSDRDVLVRKLASIKGIKVLITTGIFAKEVDATADILIVGDRLDEKEVESVVRGAESIVGRDLRCAILDTNDFVYRLNTHDQMVRGILDYPHFTHLDSIGVLEDVA